MKKPKEIYDQRCGKVNFLTERKAELAAFRIRVAESCDPLRAYKCDRCAFWHITRWPQEVFEQVREAHTRALR